MMKEYRVVWIQCPTNYHTPHVLFIRAASAEDADRIARDHIERAFGLEWFRIRDVSETKPIPEGKVVAE